MFRNSWQVKSFPIYLQIPLVTKNIEITRKFDSAKITKTSSFCKSTMQSYLLHLLAKPH